MKYLIVVDMQNDFIDGALGTQEAQGIVQNVCNKIKELKEKGYEIIATRDTHFGADDADESKRYMNTQEGSKLPVPHCIYGTSGWEIADPVKAAIGDAKVFDKYTFGSEELAHYMKSVNPEEIELLGLCTDICVVSNALMIKAFLPEIPMKIAADCCAGVTVESHNAALKTMSMCQVEIY
ncbi:MAG: cysteine hydrolase [Lachnospiraceae bacterium]|nr:cysteine hydrolase [Lachnospiraceae bacterium]